jgi:hypothetical protein
VRRDDGPRVGSARACARCQATFRVERATRFSPHCPGCRRWHQVIGFSIMLGLLLLYIVAVVLSSAH